MYFKQDDKEQGYIDCAQSYIRGDLVNTLWISSNEEEKASKVPKLIMSLKH